MFQALIRKKVLEFRVKKEAIPLLFLLGVSLLQFVRLAFDTPEARFLPLVPVVFLAWAWGAISAATSFRGDDSQAHRFLDYLPLRRSAIWLVNYSYGLLLLGLGAAVLLWSTVLVLPSPIDAVAPEYNLSHGLLLPAYLVPDRCAMIVFCGSALFWLFSVVAFPAAFRDGPDTPASGAGWAVIAMLASMGAPVAVIAMLGWLRVVPSALALSPILLVSGALYSLGSFALSVWTPKHLSAGGRGIIAVALFLAISGALAGHLYAQHLAWRVFDPSLPMRIGPLRQPHRRNPDLLLADVYSYRSGSHYVAFHVADSTYHDLGRGLAHINDSENNSGLLYFGYAASGREFDSPPSCWEQFLCVRPDATRLESFKFPGGRICSGNVRWLPDVRLVAYVDRPEEDRRYYLCVIDTSGSLLRRFEIGDLRFLASSAGKAIAVAPPEDTGDLRHAPLREGAAYLLIDLEGGTVRPIRFPGTVECVAPDLRRVICSRTRIRDGRLYTSFVLVDLPNMAERVILSDADLPATVVTSQVDLSVNPGLPSGLTIGNDRTPLLLMNHAFDTALWARRRVEGDQFRHSIILVDLGTGKRQLIVPESATLPVPVVMAQDDRGWPTTLETFTADQRGFLYTIGARLYHCDIASRQTVLMADDEIHLDTAKGGGQLEPDGKSRYRVACSPAIRSPSQKRALRYVNIWDRLPIDNQKVRLDMAAIDVFRDGRPVRRYSGDRPIWQACWLDDERIVFQEDSTLLLLESDGGMPRQIFPPITNRATE